MVTEKMLKDIPKVELHDHLDGGLRPQTILELAKDQGIENLPADTAEDLASWLYRGADRKNLGLYLEGFAVTISVMQTREALRQIVIIGLFTID